MMATMQEMANDGRTTRTVIAQILAARYVAKLEQWRRAPPGTFERVREIAYAVVGAFGDGCQPAGLIAENAGSDDVISIVRFAAGGGLEAAHERATEAV